jgi:uncharacterized membrane protein YdjX (TVP38/TMEM64 family)
MQPTIRGGYAMTKSAWRHTLEEMSDHALQAPTPPPAPPAPPAAPAAKPHPVRDFLRQIGPAGPVALIATCMPLAGAVALAATAHPVTYWLHAHSWLGLIVFSLAFSLLAGFALVPTYANSILGGWTFKFAIGFPAVMAGMVGAATISYLIAHRIIGHRVSNAIHEHPRWELVRDALVGGSTAKVTGIITLLRLSPLLPYETTNVLLASCEVRLLPYLIGTAIGVAPRTAAMVWIASRMHKLELSTPGHRGLLIWSIAGAICVIAVLAYVSKHALARATARQ